MVIIKELRCLVMSESFTSSEKDALASFCKSHREIEDIKNDIKDKRKEITCNKKAHIQQLQDLLEKGDSTIYQIPVDAEDADSEMPTFVRLKSSNSLRSITADILTSALTTMSEECVREEFEKSKKRKRKRNDDSVIREMFQRAVMDCIRKERSTPKMVVDFTKAPPRGVNLDFVPEASEEFLTLVKHVVSAKQNIKEVKEDFQNELDSALQRKEISQQHVDAFMLKHDKQDFRLNVQVDGQRVPYFIRRRLNKSKGQMSVKELTGYVSEALDSLFDTVGDSEDTVYAQLEMFKKTVLEHVLGRLEEREEKVEEKLVLHRGRPFEVSQSSVFGDHE